VRAVVLRHAVCGGVSGCVEDADAAGGVLNDGEDEQSCAGRGSGFEEVGGEDGVCLAAWEGGPGLVVAMRRRFDGVGSEDSQTLSRLSFSRLGGPASVCRPARWAVDAVFGRSAC
jgi:hypothetical protein